MSSRIEDVHNSNSSNRDPAAPLLDEFAPLRRAGKCIYKVVKQRDAFAQQRDEAMERNTQLTEELAAASAKVHLLQQMLRDCYAPALSLAQSLLPGTAPHMAPISFQDEPYVQASVPDSPHAYEGSNSGILEHLHHPLDLGTLLFTPPPSIVQYSYPSPASTEVAAPVVHDGHSPEVRNVALNYCHPNDSGSSNDNMHGLPLLDGFSHLGQISGSNGNANLTVHADSLLNLYVSSVGSSIDLPSQIGDDDTDYPESPTARPAAMFAEGVRASHVSRVSMTSMAQDSEGVDGSRLGGCDEDEAMTDAGSDVNEEHVNDEDGGEESEEGLLST